MKSARLLGAPGAESESFEEYGNCLAVAETSGAIGADDLIEDLPGEEWRALAEFPLYDVSNLGRVRSRFGSFARLMKPARSSAGYPITALYLADKSRKSRRIHVLIAAAFKGPRPAGLVINHIDANKANNRADNLEYVTPKENSQHAGRLGLNGFRVRLCRLCKERGHMVRSCRLAAARGAA